VNVAIVGCGVIGQQYAREMQRYEQLELVAAIDLLPEQAGKHVYSEKPLALRCDEARR